MRDSPRSTSRWHRRKRSVRGTSPRWSLPTSSSPPYPKSCGISTNRWPTLRWCHSSSSPARRESTSRWCYPGRAPTSFSAGTPSTGSRCRSSLSTICPGRCGARWATLSKPLPDGMRGKSLLHRGSLTLQQRYYGNARSFSDAQLRDVLPGFRDGLDAHRRDGTAVRRISATGTRWRACSTSTCSPGCAATFWSRPTR